MTETATAKKKKLGSWVERQLARLKELARRKTKTEKIVVKDGKREPIAAPMFPSRNPVRPRAQRQRVGNPDGKTFEERFPNYVCAVRPAISQDVAGRIRISAKPSIPQAPSWGAMRVLRGGSRNVGTHKSGGRIKGGTGGTG